MQLLVSAVDTWYKANQLQFKNFKYKELLFSVNKSNPPFQMSHWKAAH